MHARQLTGIREVFQERGLANQGRAPRRLVFRMPQVGPPAALDPVQVISATACRDLSLISRGVERQRALPLLFPASFFSTRGSLL